MTCIAALIHDRRIWMGGDSAITSEDFRGAVAHPKVWLSEPHVIGVAGTLRVQQVVGATFSPGPPIGPLRRWVHVMLPRLLIDCLDDALIDRRAKDFDLELLVGFKGHLYTIDRTFSVTESVEYAAIGSGSAFALGSLASTDGEPEERLQTALLAAEKHDPSVAAPFTILSSNAS